MPLSRHPSPWLPISLMALAGPAGRGCWNKPGCVVRHWRPAARPFSPSQYHRSSRSNAAVTPFNPTSYNSFCAPFLADRIPQRANPLLDVVVGARVFRVLLLEGKGDVEGP